MLSETLRSAEAQDVSYRIVSETFLHIKFPKRVSIKVNIVRSTGKIPLDRRFLACTGVLISAFLSLFLFSLKFSWQALTNQFLGEVGKKILGQTFPTHAHPGSN